MYPFIRVIYEMALITRLKHSSHISLWSSSLKDSSRNVILSRTTTKFPALQRSLKSDISVFEVDLRARRSPSAFVLQAEKRLFESWKDLMTEGSGGFGWSVQTSSSLPSFSSSTRDVTWGSIVLWGGFSMDDPTLPLPSAFCSLRRCRLSRLRMAFAALIFTLCLADVQ